MKRTLLVVALALALATQALAAPINPSPTTSPVPTQVKHISSTITAVGGGSGPRISPSIPKALTGKASGEYRVTSTLSVTWDGTRISAATRYVGTKVIKEIFDAP